ncbi:MAG: DUF6503 family protein [Cyclobacteriaceae bacterium]
MKPIYHLITIVLLSSCASSHEKKAYPDPYAHIQDDQVKQILKQAIDKAGGYETWTKIKSIKYTKKNQLFLEDGTLEVDNVQRHEYIMQPQFEATITWDDSLGNHRIEYGPNKVQRLLNDSITGSDPTETVMSAMYVLGMPFKLLDAGTNLSFDGVVKMDGKQANSIKATYNPAENENHSTQDAWWYYFDKDNGLFMGAMVYHAPTYAYIQNLEFHENLPVKLHAHRKSYRSDSARNIQFLRAEFWYSDYTVE